MITFSFSTGFLFEKKKKCCVRGGYKSNRNAGLDVCDDILDGLLSRGIKEEAIGEAINLGSGNEHRVIDLANMVNELTGNETGIKYAERRDWDVKSNF
ncbi:hypothetical protein C5S32_07945 [ANME-1 cluster archaeon GoMg1]|nr:hypothetical protein [ANME-1 cluster archaeon GoMg1]